MQRCDRRRYELAKGLISQAELFSARCKDAVSVAMARAVPTPPPEGTSNSLRRYVLYLGETGIYKTSSDC